jgi:acetyl-CoA carboxylase biotin carboxyl carrier protein
VRAAHGTATPSAVPPYAPVTASVGPMPRAQEIEIVAEMVANVLTVYVATGDTVTPGDTVVLLESMKMEIPVVAEHGGTVTGIWVGPGDVVQEGDVLLALAG